MNMSRKYHLVVSGFNCYNYVERCLKSISEQDYVNFDVCVVDDASTDERQVPLLKKLTEQYRFDLLLRTKNAGALRSQHEAIQRFDCKEQDTLVWCDLDDALSCPESLSILDTYYEDSTPLTYGTYQPIPASSTCPPVSRYSKECEQVNGYRQMFKYGVNFNHLRTLRWELYRELIPERDFMFNGEWISVGSDYAVMLPALELSGGLYKVIPEILYNYSSDNELSEWRRFQGATEAPHKYLMSLPPKEPIFL